MKKHLFAIAAALLPLSVFAQKFALQDNGDLQVTYQGKPIIVSEQFSLLQKNGFAGIDSRTEKIGEHTVLNRFGTMEKLQFRREAVLKNNGREVEISFQFELPAYSRYADSQLKFYAIYLPYKEFANYSYKAVQGRVSKAFWSKGVIPADAPEGAQLAKGNIRQITLTAPDKHRSITIDCSPAGSNDFYSDYPPNAGIMSLWSFTRRGDFIEIKVSYTPHFYGGSLAAKLQIYEALPENDYSLRHARLNGKYFSELPADEQFVFGAKKFGKMYTNAGTTSFAAGKKYGWLDNLQLKQESFAPSGAYYSAVYSDKSATFRMTGLRKGLHLITVAIPTYDRPVKNMSIAVNGKKYINALSAAPMRVTHASFPVWIENGSADVTFEGDWRLATLNDSLLQTSYEDLTFKRGFWVSTAGPHPSVMFQSGHYAKEPEYNFNISSYALPIPGEEMKKTRKALEYPTAYADFTGKKDWRGGAMIGSLGPGNNGSFAEFADPASLQRRLSELKQDQTSVIMLNGFLSRHTYPAHLDRVKAMSKRINSEGHKLGMKFLDHSDYSLLWQCDSGYRVMTERMEQLQFTVTSHLPARGLCPTNPIAKRVFFDYMTDFVKSTDIDGIMVDEIAFHGDNFCGCAWCREAFTRDTNWVLPADETSEHLLNRNSPLWRAWLAWRQKVIGDFWVELRGELKPVKPELVFIGYTTHYGMWGNYASLTTSAVLEQFCRSYDFIGTEIMTRNAFASYRGTYSMRKMKNMYRNCYGIPVFGLVYNDARDWDVMYFGWALNNMHAQTTWQMRGFQRPEGKSDYRAFTEEKGNMSHKTARSMAKILLYFSNSSRDCSKSISPINELMGWSQLLSSKHVPHEFINDQGLNQETLKNYPVLIVATATSLSKQDIAEIKKYVENGGVVYASGFVGYYDEIAQKRAHWLFGQELLNGADYMKDDTAGYKKLRVCATGEEISSDAPVRYARYFYPKGKNKLNVLWEFVINDKGTTVPALMYNQIGKGRVYFSPAIFATPAYSIEVTSKNIIKFQRKPQAEALAWQILDMFITPEHRIWDASGIPEQVLTSIYKTTGNRIAVHLLNATKSNYKPGDKIPSTAPANAYDPLQEVMSFTIPTDGKVKSVYACSPDFEGKKILPYTVQDNAVKVTVPAGTLQCYMIIYIEQ
ncbi:MAG: hypothetical protein E7047_05540 [Lentisphaerae bacterium]|nr:hypothetical protein [Lentisphaerota bacterium]